MNLSPELRRDLREICRFLFENPELGFHEFKASDLQCSLLEKLGFTVTRGLADLPTSYKAEKILNGGNGPHFGFFSEYDALAEIGHACGHNLICVSSIAATVLTVAELEKRGISGRITLFGTPGEEQLGGKVRMKAAGVFDGVDAGLISHPYDLTSCDDGAYSVRRYSVKFHGKASHAGMAPHLGINALDALILFFNGIGLWRQQMPEASRVHGIILKGGDAPNVIPSETEAFFYLRARDLQTTLAMSERFCAIAAGAAEQTGCTCDCDLVSAYAPCLVNAPFNTAYADLLEEMGEPVIRANGTEGRASTDFGDVSQMMPGANLHFGICDHGGVPLHSIDFREAAGTDHAFDQAMKAAHVMALLGVKYYTEPDFRNAVHADFRSKSNS
ncbi:MAG: M20 family metallopeptidase [Lentisphaeria bacterium]|nr:M20 family metallopeptidase [Lentisphaeria bacterium]